MTRTTIVLIAAITMALGLCAAPPAMAQGCAMCGTAFNNSSDPLTRSMASSILFMISMPFLLFFSAAGWIVYRFRRTRPRSERGSDDTSEENTH